ncbi:MAG: DNA repair protein RecN [Calditrichaeota bacterium]|nr:MAG: DNA repair protein RecN [Calditrichota bacterium]MBL1208096.1 DNA repair protein RecN [Calditrichota bacterium]NOG47934.1 DNA repair protein RecN [Calditrichota bacterium]
MIKSLLIKNFALIDNSEILFQKGLNILTGESGAGKSILVNAISQLCGERSNLDFIKAGSKKAVIEAEINLSERPEIIPHLQHLEIEIEDNILLIRKEINQSGSSRIFLNDTPVHLSSLNQISTFLIDLHGQHQHQVLLHPENHLSYLDSFASLQSSVNDFGTMVKNYQTLKNDLKRLEDERAKALQMKDLYNFQIGEIEEAGLEEIDFVQLKDELAILSNYEKVHQSAQFLIDNLTLGEINATKLVTESENHLKNLAAIDHQFEELLKNLISSRETIEEIGQFSERYLSNLEFDPKRAESLRQHIAQIEFLLKKYQKSDIPDLLSFKNELKTKLDEIENYDSHLANLKKEKSQIEKIILDSGIELSQKRKEAAREFERKLSAFLDEIGMKDSRFEFVQESVSFGDSPFEIGQQKVKLFPTGFDQILINFSPNPGEGIKPINKIASGGEISRIMLALKSVLAEKDKMPVLVFDEIDSGISGKVAQIVGKKISELSRYHQVICITHLPQIAAFADSHFKVDKKAEAGITKVSINTLDFEDQVSEIANLLGGVSLSQQALDNASQLLNEASKIK